MRLPRIFRIGLITILAIAVIGIVGVTALLFIVNPNEYKPLIIKAVNQNTGRQLSLQGDISWKIWPNIGLHIQNVSLSNPPEFKEQNFVSAAAIDVSVQLLPLLHHSIIVNSLTLDGLDLSLIKDGEKNNWTFTTESTVALTNAESTPPSPIHLELNSFNLKNSTISYADLEKKANTKIKDVDFIISSGNNGTISIEKDQDNELINLKNVTFNFDNMLKGTSNLALNNFSEPQYKGDLNIEEFSITNFTNKLNMPIKALTNKTLFDKFALSTKFSGNKDKVSLENTHFNFANDIKGSTNITVNNLKQPVYTGNLKIDITSISNVLNKLSIKQSTKGLNSKISATTQFNGNSNSLKLNNLVFNLADYLKGTSNVNISDFTNLNYTGSINLPTFSLNQIIEQFGMDKIDIPNKTLLNQVAYTSNFSGNTNSIKLDQIKAKIANSNLNGNIDVSSIKPLKLTENLLLDKIELSDLADTYGYKLPLTGIKANGSFSNGNSDIKKFNTVDANQNISINNVTILGFSLNNLVHELDSAITTTGKIAAIDNTQQINNSIQVIDKIKNMQAAIAKATTKGAKDYNQKTNLGNLQANTVINNGIANPASFKLNGPSIKISGQGSINLVQKTLNYTVTSQLVTPQKNDILNIIAFPYNAHGSLDQIEGSLDWVSIEKQLTDYLVKNATKQIKSVAKDQAQKQINSVIDKQVPQGAEPLKQGAQKLLNGIFGN